MAYRMDNFYAITRAQRSSLFRYEPGSEHEIGGRATDVSQLAHSVRRIVEHQFLGPVPEELQTMINDLVRTGDHMESLIRQLLDLASKELARTWPKDAR